MYQVTNAYWTKVGKLNWYASQKCIDQSTKVKQINYSNINVEVSSSVYLQTKNKCWRQSTISELNNNSMAKNMTDQFFFKSVVWNIEGLTSNNFSTFSRNNFTYPYHWTADIDRNFNIPGFQLIGESNRTKHEKARRNSGGINLFVKNVIAKGVSRLQKITLWYPMGKIRQIFVPSG